MKYSVDYPYDEFLLENYEINIHEIWLYETKISFDKRLGKNSSLLKKNELGYLIDIIEKISEKNKNNIREYRDDDEYFIRNKRKSETIISLDDKLRLGFFIRRNKLIQYDALSVIDRENENYDFLFALKLRQYHLAPDLLQGFLNFHFKKAFKKRIDIFRAFVINEILDKYSDMFIDNLSSKVYHIVDSNKFKYISNKKHNKLLLKVKPSLPRKEIESYFLKLSHPYGVDSLPIVTEKNIRLFLKANFFEFSETESIFRENIKISFEQKKVKSLVKRYFYEFSRNMSTGEILGQYSIILFDSFVDFKDTDYNTIIKTFSVRANKKYKEFLNLS